MAGIDGQDLKGISTELWGIRRMNRSRRTVFQKAQIALGKAYREERTCLEGYINMARGWGEN